MVGGILFIQKKTLATGTMYTIIWLKSNKMHMMKQ